MEQRNTPPSSQTAGSRPASDGDRLESASRRFRQAMVLVLLGLVIALHAGLTLHWIHVDQSVGLPVFSEMILPVNHFLIAKARGELLQYFMELRPGLMTWLAAPLSFVAGGNPDFLLWTALLFTAATQLVLFDVGRRMGGPGVGLLAAALFPLYPDVALMTRRWAPSTMHFFFLVAALDCLIVSRSFSRLSGASGFSLCVVCGMLTSAMITDDLLFLCAAGAMAVGAAARGLGTGRGPLPGQAVSRFKSIVVGVLAALPILLVAWHLWNHHLDPNYLVQEAVASTYQAQVPWWHFAALTAYSRSMYTTAVTPLMSGVFVLALAVYSRRGRARAELLAWIFVPLVILSLIAKKNTYYVSVIYPAIPLVTALGLRALSSPRARTLLTAGLLVVGCLQWLNRSFPSVERPLSGVFANAKAIPDAADVFQTVPKQQLHPLPRYRYEREASLLGDHLEASSCNEPAGVTMLFSGDYQGLRLLLLLSGKCTVMWAWPEIQSLLEADWILVELPSCEAAALEFAGSTGTAGESSAPAPWATLARELETSSRFHQVAEDPTRLPCLRLYAATRPVPPAPDVAEPSGVSRDPGGS